jgi:hypothetical protein
MRSIARKPTNATATTIVKSEIGRRNANDTRFIVPALPRPDDRARLDGSNKDYGDTAEKCGSSWYPNAQPRGQNTSSGEQNLDGEPSWDAGGLQAPTTEDIIQRDRSRKVSRTHCTRL